MKRLTFPTLIFYGAADNSPFTGSLVAGHFHEVLPNSILVGMEQSGHWPYLEEPEKFQTTLLEFLNR
jgi:pimeloyl-ACP methyl ester carboxylesterase